MVGSARSTLRTSARQRPIPRHEVRKADCCAMITCRATTVRPWPPALARARRQRVRGAGLAERVVASEQPLAGVTRIASPAT
jgi:hypothetical protein